MNRLSASRLIWDAQAGRFAASDVAAVNVLIVLGVCERLLGVYGVS